MTDKDIIKALECCKHLNNKCDKCPYRERGCQYKLSADALDLIKQLQAENERLKEIEYMYNDLCK